MNYKIAMLGSDICLESFVKLLNDTSITFIADEPKSQVFEFACKLGIQCKYVPFEELSAYFSANNFDLIVLTNYDRILPQDVVTIGKFVNIHPSLLPAFKGPDAIMRSFMSGIKVSGVTVHWINSEVDGGKIIAQYPVLIGNSTHFDEFKAEIIKVENMLYPIVVQKILKDEVFDFTDLVGSFSNGCSNNCAGCKNCN